MSLVNGKNMSWFAFFKYNFIEVSLQLSLLDIKDLRYSNDSCLLNLIAKVSSLKETLILINSLTTGVVVEDVDGVEKNWDSLSGNECDLLYLLLATISEDFVTGNDWILEWSGGGSGGVKWIWKGTNASFGEAGTSFVGIEALDGLLDVKDELGFKFSSIISFEIFGALNRSTSKSPCLGVIHCFNIAKYGNLYLFRMIKLM